MKNNKNKLKRKVLPFPSKFLSSSITWLGKLMKISNTELKFLLQVLLKIARVHDTRGKSECIKYSKHLRSSLINYLLSEDGVQNYLPKPLLPFKSRFRLSENWNYPLIRLVLSVTYSSRLLRLKENPNFESIETRPGYTGNPLSLESEIRDFLKKGLGVNPRHFGRVPKSLRFKKFHMTSKSGPTGYHALWSSFWDVIHLDDHLKSKIITLGGDYLGDLMNRFSSLYFRIPDFFKSFASQEVMCLRKISCIRDKEGKTREVAILDYWSQSALRPLHSFLFRLLSRIHQDCTHDQTKLIKKLVPRKGSKFHSIDLTTATDRFPIAIEKLILSIWFGKEYADAWEHIMVGLPFYYKGRSINYNTGNPMGAYSSWATFAIAHHFFIYLACKRAKVNWKKCPYMLLGDDIVIADDIVAKNYKDLLSEWDIPYNPEKSHTSSKGYEFAKQYVLDGENISPFPVAALYERRRSTFECLSIVARELTYKDWNSDIWVSLKSFLIIVLGKTRSEIRTTFPKLKLGISLMFYLQGKSDLGTSIKDYVAETTNKKVSWTRMSMTAYEQFIAADVVTNLFLEVRDRVTGNNPYPLGELATMMVMAITSLEEDGADCFDKIEAVPFLQIYGRAEETFLKISKPTIGARLIRDGSQMRSALEVVDIPLSDRDFYVRQRDVIVIKALKASKMIVKLLRSHMVRINNYHRNPIGSLKPLN